MKRPNAHCVRAQVYIPCFSKLCSVAFCLEFSRSRTIHVCAGEQLMHCRLGIATQAHPVSKSYVGNCEGVSLPQISDYRSQVSVKNCADFDAENAEQAHGQILDRSHTRCRTGAQRPIPMRRGCRSFLIVLVAFVEIGRCAPVLWL